MKTARTEKKGVTQTSNGKARSSTVEALRPNSGNTEKRGTSKQDPCGLDTPVAPLIATRSHEQITERAKAIWAQHGRVAGQDQANWYEAEAQLRTES